ncbi:methyltransferase family protein [Nocardiopsis coralliicola]
MRSRSAAAYGSILFFIIAPGTVVGLLPWLITRWQFHQPLPFWWAAQAPGALLIAGGVAVLVSAFVQFVRARGVPAPVAPTEHLVVEGPNRRVRNPMYVAIAAALIGQALLFGSVWMLLYAAAVTAGFMAFVRFYEEPTLARQFGDDYAQYRRNVPGWVPRLHAWSP